MTILKQTKANGVKRYGKPQCEATDCQKSVHFHSTDGLCIKCWHRSRTEPVRRKSEDREDARRRSESAQRKQRLEAKKDRT